MNPRVKGGLDSRPYVSTRQIPSSLSVNRLVSSHKIHQEKSPVASPRAGVSQLALPPSKRILPAVCIFRRRLPEIPAESLPPDFAALRTLVCSRGWQLSAGIGGKLRRNAWLESSCGGLMKPRRRGLPVHRCDLSQEMMHDPAPMDIPPPCNSEGNFLVD